MAQIVAAFNPHDLDAMDESIPFTKQVLDNLLGYQSSVEEYRYYFDGFIQAQKKLPLKSFQHTFLRELPSMYNQFLVFRHVDSTSLKPYCHTEQPRLLYGWDLSNLSSYLYYPY